MAYFSSFWIRAPSGERSLLFPDLVDVPLPCAPFATSPCQCPKWSASQPKSHPSVCSSHFLQRTHPQHNRSGAQTIATQIEQVTKSRDYHGLSPGFSDVSLTAPDSHTPFASTQPGESSVYHQPHHTTVDNRKTRKYYHLLGTGSSSCRSTASLNALFPLATTLIVHRIFTITLQDRSLPFRQLYTDT